ncbi:MAG TPA: hypothetical protein VHB20_16580 [Verrucomicrobiae bacterium]|jgi:ElaB/YqjD/DUF883 family membrane-anchored ribosome-binding protein|nr:hypothetical protein [Verrucomicrobiae bacterium]
MSVDLTDRLSEDLAALARDAEAILKGKGEDKAERAQEIRDRLAEALATADKTINTLNSGAPSSSNALESFVRDKPYYALGIALGVGLALGYLFKRKQP